MKKIFLSLLSLIIAVTSFSQADTAIKKVEYPAGYEAKIDVVYHEVNGWKGREDIYYNPTANKPTPVVFNIHGGGWNHGTKETQTGFSTWFKMGFAVANVEYRLTQEGTAPAAVEDVRAALLYVVEHAKELNIDPHKIVIMGGSAGGHLAMMAGFLDKNNQFDGQYKHVKNFTIQAVVDKYGIADVWDWAYGKVVSSRSAKNWLGNKANDEAFAKSMSPIYHVNKNTPPVFIVHGDADPTVPYQQSVDLKKKLDDAGVKNEFLTIPGGLHGKFTKEQNSEINKAMVAFLRSLKFLDK